MSRRTRVVWLIRAALLATICGCSHEAAAPTESAAPAPTLSSAPLDSQHTGPPGFIYRSDPAAVVSGDDLFPPITNRVATTSALLNSFFNNVTPGASQLLLSNEDVEALRHSRTDVVILARDYSSSPSDEASAPQLTSGALSNLEAFLRQGGCVATEFSSNTLWFQNHNWSFGIGAPTLPTLAFPPTVGVEGGFLTEFDDPVDSHTVVRSRSPFANGLPTPFADAPKGGGAGDLDGNLFGDLAGLGIKVVTQDSDEDAGAPPVAIETVASAKVDAGTAVLMLSDWQDINSVIPADIDPEIGRLWVNVANCPVTPAPELIFTVVFDVTSTAGRPDVVLYDNLQLGTVPLPGLNDPTKSDRNPTISSDERFIAFTSSRSGAGDVILYDRATESVVPLPGLNSAAAFDGSPSLSEDGNLIAFESKRNGDTDVFLYDRTAGALLLLAGLNAAGSNDGVPAISAAGRWIAFESDRSGNVDVLLYDRETQSLVPLPGLNTGAVEGAPNLARGERLVAFKSDRSGNGDIFLYDSEIQGLVSLPGLNSPSAHDGNPSITRAGRYIAFVSDRTGVPSILVYDRKNSALLSVPGLDTPDLELRPEIR